MKRCKNKRKLAMLGLAAAMALSLAACGEKRPSQEDVEQSIEAGTLTIEDALDKGWVDQAWVDAYYEENSVPAASKTESNMVGDFATTTLSGEAFTREQLGDVVFFAFLDRKRRGRRSSITHWRRDMRALRRMGRKSWSAPKAEPAARCLPMHPSPSSSTTTLWQQLWAATEAWWRTGRCQTSPPGM